MMTGRTLLITAAILALALITGCKDGKNAPAGQSESIQAEQADKYARPPADSLAFRKDAELQISSPDGSVVRGNFDVEIAVTEEATMRGLMWRERMEDYQGMLFDPDGLSNTSFWMKNTYLALDMIFIGEDRKIIYIAENTKPFSEERVSPGGIYRYVLEVKAGTCYKHNIKIGDMVTWNET